MRSGSSTAISSTSKPNCFARTTNPSDSSPKGDVQIHVDAPRGFISLLSRSESGAYNY